MFRKKKTTASISIKNTGETVNFNVAWDKNNPEQIKLFIELLVLLNNGDLKDYIEKAIEHYGNMCNDQETASQILFTVRNINSSIGRKSLESKYLNQLLVGKRRNPAIPPSEVLNIFKNSIS